MSISITYRVDATAARRSSPAELAADLARARALHIEGDFANAKAIYQGILAADPRHSQALNLLGLIAAQTHDPALAAGLFDRALECDPRNIEALCNKGTLLRQEHRFEAALSLYEQAIEIDGAFAPAHLSRASVLQELQRFDDALKSCDDALRVNAGIPEAHFAKGLILQALHREETALASFDRAIGLAGDFAEAHCSRGHMLLELGTLGEALTALDKAIALDPDYAAAHLMKSMVLLLQGDYARGWPESEWRWKSETSSSYRERRRYAQPQWTGNESIAGKRILLWAEQGLGDTIQFCRYASGVAALGGVVTLEVQAPLFRLLGKLEGVSRLVAGGEALCDADYHCPLLSLPLALQLAGAPAQPSGKRYLASEAGKVARWHSTLSRLSDPGLARVGLVWSGSTTHSRDARRSIPLARLIRHLPPGMRYVSLQREVRDADRAALASAPHVLDVSHELNDFSDTAALCECLDLVISVDTSVAHLSGALGKPTWILLPFSPDWRWSLVHPDRSSWYDEARLFRQPAKDDWASVLEAVHGELVARFTKR